MGIRGSEAVVHAMASTFNLTAAQRRVIERAKNDPLGLGIIEYRGHGYGKRPWVAMMKTLCEHGLFEPYVHGGYELTDAGRNI